MLVNGNVPVRQFQEMSSKKISTIGARPIAGHGIPFKEKKKQKAKLKYKKIKASERLVAPVEMLEDYCYEPEDKPTLLGSIRQSLNIIKEKDSGGNFFLSGLPEEPVSSPKYFKTSYLIINIESPELRVGLGTEAIKSLVEKSVVEDDVEGRILVYITQVSPEDTSYQFFYKLGFRFVENSLNDAVKAELEKDISELLIPQCYMYLPKSNVQKLLNYGQLF